MLTFREHLDRTTAHWRERWQFTPQDGLALMAFKWFASISATKWHGLFFRNVVPWFERPSYAIAVTRLKGNSSDQYRLAIDFYKITMSLILGVCYASSIWHPTNSWLVIASGVLLSASIAFAIGRVCELTSLLVGLHTDSQYRPKTVFRTVVNSFWHYLEITLCYSVFYIALVKVNANSISSSSSSFSLLDDWLGPAYFSFVAVSTVGFGDFVPTDSISRLIVVSQVVLGFFLFLIVLPNCVAQLDRRDGEKVNHGNTRHLRSSIMLSEELPWLTQATFNRDGFLSSGDGRFEIGAVLLLLDPARKMVVLIRKAAKEGYEFSNMLALPGGMIRTMEGSGTVLNCILNSLIERVYLECGLRVDSGDIVSMEMAPPPVTRYTVKGEPRYVVVLPFACAISDCSKLQSIVSSVSEASWVDIAADWNWDEVTPACRIVLVNGIWSLLSGEDRDNAIKSVGESQRKCNEWASEAGLPRSPH